MLKKIIVLVGIVAFACSFQALAKHNENNKTQPHGPYIGTQFGLVSHDYDVNNFVRVPSAKVYNNKFGGRVYFGYAYDSSLATEIGYTYYNNPKFIIQNTGVTNQFSEHGVDLVARATMPFKYGLGSYLKAGGTWIYRSATDRNGSSFINKDPSNKFAFLIGGAFTASFLTHWMVDLSWTRIFTNGDLPKTDFYALGLNYKF